MRLLQKIPTFSFFFYFSNERAELLASNSLGRDALLKSTKYIAVLLISVTLFPNQRLCRLIGEDFHPLFLHWHEIPSGVYPHHRTAPNDCLEIGCLHFTIIGVIASICRVTALKCFERDAHTYRIAACGTERHAHGRVVMELDCNERLGDRSDTNTVSECVRAILAVLAIATKQRPASVRTARANSILVDTYKANAKDV